MSEKTNNETTEMTASGGDGILADSDVLAEAAEDLAGLQLTFDRVKIPSGGASAFEIPGDGDDETELVKEHVRAASITDSEAVTARQRHARTAE